MSGTCQAPQVGSSLAAARDIKFIVIEKPTNHVPGIHISQIRSHVTRQQQQRKRAVIVRPSREDRQSSILNRIHPKPPPRPNDSMTDTKPQRFDEDDLLNRPTLLKLTVRDGDGLSSNSSIGESHSTIADLIAEGGHVEGLHTFISNRTHAAGQASEAVSKRHCFRAQMATTWLPHSAIWADMHFGGFRVDPFLEYPIESQEYFAHTIDYCKEMVVPDPKYFQFIMTHGVLFRAVITYALCVMPAQDSRKKLAMMYHYGRSLATIKRLLYSSGDIGDAVLGAIANLAIICAYHNDIKGFHLHREAIHSLVELRGGWKVVENPHSFNKYYLSTVEAFAKRDGTTTEPNIGPGTTLDYFSLSNYEEPSYPTHPFPSELCALIARMPDGFREIAMQGHLSCQVLHRLTMAGRQIVVLMARSSSDRETSRHFLRKLTPLERMSWLGFLVTYVRGLTFISDCEDLAEAVMECSEEIAPSDQSRNECILWGACLIIAAPDNEGRVLRHREMVIKMVLARYEVNFEEIEQVARKFLWTQSMSASLATNLLHRCPTRTTTLSNRAPK